MHRHRKSIRLSRFNYTNPGFYFVTFLTKQRIQYLSKIVGAKIRLTSHGAILMETIMKCFEHLPLIQISDIAIMPDHVHFIVSLKSPNHKSSPTLTNPPLRISPVSGSLGSIVRTIKSVSARKIRKTTPSFSWHRNYYERIIRDDIALHNVKRYIAMNPQRWEESGRSK